LYNELLHMQWALGPNVGSVIDRPDPTRPAAGIPIFVAYPVTRMIIIRPTLRKCKIGLWFCGIVEVTRPNVIWGRNPRRESSTDGTGITGHRLRVWVG